MQSILSKSLFSKILASEDIHLKVLKEAKTASFNYSNRTLTLPAWDVSDELERLFISHEVGHAKFTDPDKRKDFIESYPEDLQPKVQRALNIVEDGRIEKLIIRKYPGLKKDYVTGYIELVEKFAFFTGTYDNVFDKLNHHFKVVVSGQGKEIYNFDPEEQGYVDRMLALETYDETLELTRDLIARYPDDLQSAETVTIFTADLSGEMDAETECECSLEEIPKEKVTPLHIGNYHLQEVNPNRYIRRHTRKGLAVPSDNKVVQYMNARFRKKMNAANYASQQRRKTGNIDPVYLYRYRYDEKIFETNIIKQKQKNHCVILLVDGSGSMDNIMKSVADQAYNIAEFCRLAKIAFECYVFQSDEGTTIEGFGRQSRVKLSEFFASGSNFTIEKSVMSKMASGSTPLSEAMVVLLRKVRELKQKYDVVNLMTITDGDCQNSYKQFDVFRYRSIYITPDEQIVDVPTAMCKIYRDFYDVNIISFDLGTFSCYHSYNNINGVDKHFEVPLEFINNHTNSKQFLNELVDIISK